MPGRLGRVLPALGLLCTAACASPGRPWAASFGHDAPTTLRVGATMVPVSGGLPEGARPSETSARAPQAVPIRYSSSLSSLEGTSPPLRRALTTLAADASSASAYLEVAHAYLAEGVSDRAFDYLNDGLRHNPTSAALHDAVARVWRDWGFPERALRPAHTAIYHAPRSGEARNTLGTVLWALGQRAAAREAFIQATELAPMAPYGWHNLCQAELAAGNTRAATMHCQRATQLKKVARGNRP